MILGFSTQLNGKPTHFVEKIWKGLKENLSKELHAQHELQMTPEELTKPYQVDSEAYAKVKAKLHTIREDKTDRWRIGTKIDFYINVRKKNMLRFAPVLAVVSTQNFKIEWSLCKSNLNIYVNNKPFATFKNHNDGLGWRDLNLPNNRPPQGLIMVHNDGFDSVEDFLDYFNKDFKGKIIHWTDLKY